MQQEVTRELNLKQKKFGRVTLELVQDDKVLAEVLATPYATRVIGNQNIVLTQQEVCKAQLFAKKTLESLL